MTKRNIGDEIVQRMQEAVKHMRGKKTRAVIHKINILENIDLKSIRKKLELSRPAQTMRHKRKGI